MSIGFERQRNLQDPPMILGDSTMSFNYLRGIAEYLGSRNISAAPIFSGFGIEPDELSDANKRIPIKQYQAILVAAGSLANDTNVGLHVGECIKPGQYGVLGYAVMSCKIAKEAFERHERYENLVSNRATSSYDIGPEEVRLTWNTGDTPATRQMAEENVAAWVTFCRWITGQTLSPSEVRFVHSQPEDISEYKRIFNCTLLFDQPMVEVRFPNEFLDFPIIQHDPVMQEMMDAHAERLLQQFNQGDGLLKDIRRLLVEALAQGNTSLDNIAEQLALTPRTLQRRLTEQGESFKSVLDHTRSELALTYITQAYIGLPELAYLLGYTDQTAFQRAFKKWTGTTPGKYRKNHQGTTKP